VLRKSPDSEKAEPKSVRIKKYANRRLYNTESSAYVTLEDLAEMVREERDFEVVDAKSGDDLTHSVLTQIILDQESKGQNLLPVNFLRHLIRFYGHSMEGLVPSYLELSMETLSREQDRICQQFEEAVGANPLLAGGPMDALQRQTKQNMALFEQALSMFTPFGAATGGDAARSGNGAAGRSNTSAATGAGASELRSAANASQRPRGNGTASSRNQTSPGEKTATSSPAKDGDQGGELSELRAQLSAIQKQLDQLGK